MDWFVVWIRNCIKLIVYYRNHENTSHFDCLSTHLYIQDWNPCARSSAKPINSLAGPSDSIQWHRSGSTLVWVMAWCLMAPSHHLYQYGLLITTVQWDSSEAINHWSYLKNYKHKILLKSHRGQWVNQIIANNCHNHTTKPLLWLSVNIDSGNGLVPTGNMT